MMPHDSPETSFLTPKILAKLERGHLQQRRQGWWGMVKFATFHR